MVVKKSLKKIKNNWHYITVISLTFYFILLLARVPDIHASTDFPLILGAHRGDSVNYTENTLDAIKAALNNTNYNFLEFDIQYTKDQHIVVFHDKSLYRTNKIRERVPDLNYTQLSQLAKYHIPLFIEVMDLIDNGTKVNIEIKSNGNYEHDKELVDYTIEFCKERGILDNVLLSSISPEVVQYISEQYPEQKTGIVVGKYHTLLLSYVHSDMLVNNYYEFTQKIGADYVMFHGLSLHNDSIISLKPENQVLVVWYFTDKMFIVQKDPSDNIW